MPDDAIALNKVGVAPEWSGNSDCTTVEFHESFKDVRPTSCFRWFSGFVQLTKIQGIENLNTEEVEDMSEMFNNCSRLENLDLYSLSNISWNISLKV